MLYHYSADEDVVNEIKDKIIKSNFKLVRSCVKKHKNKIIICYVVLICISMLTLGKGVYLPIIGVVTSPIIEKIRGTIILSSFIILPLMLFVWLIKGAINDTIKKQQEYEQSEIDNDKISSLTERMLNNDFNFKEFDNILNKDKENHPINDYEKNIY